MTRKSDRRKSSRSEQISRIRAEVAQHIPIQKIAKGRYTLVALLTLFILISYTFLYWSDLTHQSARDQEMDSYLCGDLCSNRYRQRLQARYYPLLSRNLQCLDVMKRMSRIQLGEAWPPPRVPPAPVLRELMQAGDMPLREIRYLPEQYNNVKGSDGEEDLVMNEEMIEALRVRSAANERIMPSRFALAEIMLLRALRENRHFVKGKSALILGDKNPWLEAILINHGVGNITSIEYQIPSQAVLTTHPRIRSYTPHDMGSKYVSGLTTGSHYEIAASFLSVGHLGLGRYGERLNPWADLEALAQCWCLMVSGSRMFLVIHYDKGEQYLIWNSHRVYGDNRLMFLTADWKVVQFYTADMNSLAIGVPSDSVDTKVALLVLQRL